MVDIEVSAGTTGYRFQVSRRGRLRQLGVGDGRVALRSDVDEGGFPFAHPTYGEDLHREPALRVTHHDGVTTTRLIVEDHRHRGVDGGEEHRVYLLDRDEPLGVVLGFRTWEDDDVPEQWVEVTSRQLGAVTVHAAAAAAPCLSVPAGSPWPASADSAARGRDGAWLTHFGGGWAAEWGTVEDRLTFGTKVLEGRGRQRIPGTNRARPCSGT